MAETVNIVSERLSSCQVEIGAPSPHYWDTDEDDGFKPSELFGKHKWEIEKFSQINKSELRSSVEAGGYKCFFGDFWLGMDQNSRRGMSREKMDLILKDVVKFFFKEKEVASTLVMDSLHSGLKALEDQTKKKKAEPRLLAPIVSVENYMFVLDGDLLEKAALESLLPKQVIRPQNRKKDGNDERDERRLTELGRRTVEMFVLDHIFSIIEVAYQEAIALTRQEQLILESRGRGRNQTEDQKQSSQETILADNFLQPRNHISRQLFLLFNMLQFAFSKNPDSEFYFSFFLLRIINQTWRSTQCSLGGRKGCCFVVYT